MTIKKIIDGLYFTVGMILFNPLTGEVKTPEELNEDDRTTYDACMGAIELLKAQEPVEPVVDVDTWKCGNCGHTLEHQELLGDNVLFHEQYNYCPDCGRKVKWDG